MSWYISTALAADIHAAHDFVDRQFAHVSQALHDEVAKLIHAAAELVGQVDGYVLKIESNGHVGTDQPGSFSLNISHVPLHEAPQPDQPVSVDPAPAANPEPITTVDAQVQLAATPQPAGNEASNGPAPDAQA